MKRIIIDDKVERLAQSYVGDMLYKSPHADGAISKAVKNLKTLQNDIEHDRIGAVDTTVKGVDLHPKHKDVYKQYLQLIIDRYEELLTVHPMDFIRMFANLFESIIGKADLAIDFEQKRDENGNLSQSPHKIGNFHELIVWAMRYNHVQGTVFPKVIRTLGIKTCVYCNAQYAITTRNHESFYQLDHCCPKSLYPYLCTSFFNLQPCCGSCNQRKSAEDMRKGDYDVSIWREKNDPIEEYFHFQVEDTSLAAFELSMDKEQLKVEFQEPENAHADLKDLKTQYNQKFRIEELYQEHRDVVEEVLWKKYVYSQAYIDSLKEAFGNLPNTNGSDVARLVLGNYIDPNEVYKRPLAQLVQDVAKQVHLEIK